MRAPACTACGNQVDPSGHVLPLSIMNINEATGPGVLQMAQTLPQRVVLVVCSTCWPAMREGLEREGIAA